MLLASLRKSHGIRVTILANLSILCHTIFKFDNVLFEFFWLDFVREKELAISWSLGRIYIVPAEIENFVIDIDH